MCSKGVYDDYLCSSDTVNHAMLIVGYTPTEWILKNWWGDNWGENGYMRLAKHKNRCGIANYAAYVKVWDLFPFNLVAKRPLFFICLEKYTHIFILIFFLYLYKEYFILILRALFSDNIK